MSTAKAVAALHAFFCYLLSPLCKQKYLNAFILILQNHFPSSLQTCVTSFGQNQVKGMKL